MFVYVKDTYNSGTCRIILNKNGSETELAVVETKSEIKGKPTENEKLASFVEAVGKAKSIADALGCDLVEREVTIKECESAIMENRVTKHHTVYLLKRVKEAESHTCPSCHRCGDRS